MKIPNPIGFFRSSKTSSIEAVTKVLGEDQVLAEAGEIKIPHYVPEVFEFCAQENREGHDWRLIFKSEHTLNQVRAHDPHVFSGATPWEPLPQSWLAERISPGYRLLDFKLTALDDLEARKKFLKEKGFAASPAKTATVAESLLRLRKVSAKQFLEGRVHCAITDAVENNYPVIGWSRDRLWVRNIMLDLEHKRFPDDLGIVMCIEPQRKFLRINPFGLFTSSTQ